MVKLFLVWISLCLVENVLMVTVSKVVTVLHHSTAGYFLTLLNHHNLILIIFIRVQREQIYVKSTK